MKWDKGRLLGIIPSEDSFHKLIAQELAEEKNGLDNLLESAQVRLKTFSAQENSVEDNVL